MERSPFVCSCVMPAKETVDFRKFRCIEGKLPSPASLAGEDEGEGTSLTDWHANPRRDANFHDDEPSPAPSPAGDAGEGHNSPAVQQTELESRKSTVSFAGMTTGTTMRMSTHRFCRGAHNAVYTQGSRLARSSSEQVHASRLDPVAHISHRLNARAGAAARLNRRGRSVRRFGPSPRRTCCRSCSASASFRRAACG